MFEFIVLGMAAVFAATGCIFFYARSRWGCQHEWNDPSGEMQACKKCNLHKKAPVIGCEHEFTVLHESPIGRTVPSKKKGGQPGWMPQYTTYALQCGNCGEVRQKTVWFDKDAEKQMYGQIMDDMED